LQISIWDAISGKLLPGMRYVVWVETTRKVKDKKPQEPIAFSNFNMHVYIKYFPLNGLIKYISGICIVI
jgi:hypothetical protein